MKGYLTTAPRGTGGFGYDPIFVPDDQPVLAGGFDGRAYSAAQPTRRIALTAAELTPEQKNAISHRGKAFRALAPAIAKAITVKE